MKNTGGGGRRGRAGLPLDLEGGAHRAVVVDEGVEAVGGRDVSAAVHSETFRSVELRGGTRTVRAAGMSGYAGQRRHRAVDLHCPNGVVEGVGDEQVSVR